jgi:carboxyl-terminal processing protease
MNKILRALLALSLVGVISAAFFAGGFVTGHYLAQADQPLLGLPGAPDAASAEGGTPEDLRQTFGPFWEAWDIVHAKYVVQPLDDTALMRGAINGMIRALDDPHSSYMDPLEYEFFQTDLGGELEGIGAMVEQAGDYVRIVSPLPGSPAEAAGLRPNDLIIKVDDTDITGMDYLNVVKMVRGPAGSTVHLTIQREGESRFLEFDIVRARITIPSVESRMLDGNVAYLKINDFGEKTTGELKSQLRDLLAQNPAGLVLDLRGNPGGYLDTGIEVASQFIGEGVIVREKFGDGREKSFNAIPGGLATDIPLVVLINEGSASASEIVAGAIQDTGRGTVVGETSYGKGSVQTLESLSGDNGVVRVTVARWFTPEGRSIHRQGITPDVTVELTDEDRAAQLDPQLDEAVRLLTNGGQITHDVQSRARLGVQSRRAQARLDENGVAGFDCQKPAGLL